MEMENENITLLHPEEEVYTPVQSEEEVSVCNCENQEIVTPCEALDEEELIEALEADVETTRRERIAEKCRVVRATCSDTAARIVRDWKETEGHPYVRKTCITQVDIYRSPDDDTPVDTFRTEKVKTYSTRAIAVIGAAAVAVACTVDSIAKKLFK